jgi:hypothetical protein
MRRIKTSVPTAEKASIIITASMGDINILVKYVKGAGMFGNNNV